MHYCEVCNYKAFTSTNIKIHYNSKKHIVNINKKDNNVDDVKINNDLNTQLICVNCKKEYKYLNSLKKHQLDCNKNKNNSLVNEIKKDYEHKLEIEKLKKELEIEKLKKELEIEKIKSEYELKLKTQECENLKQISNNNSNNNNKITNNITNNINISTLDFLNTNFCNVFNIDDFIENYKKMILNGSEQHRWIN
jgi:hypothetical protein